MPELPEVETLARDLRAAVCGRTVTEAWVAPGAARLVQEMHRGSPRAGDRDDPPV